MATATTTESGSGDVGKDIYLSLPPMEQRDLHALQADLQTLGLWDGDAFLKEWGTLRANGVKVAPEVSGNQLGELVSPLFQTYQEKQYGSKPNVTSRYTIALDEDDPQTVVIRTYAELLDAGNRAAGYWAGTWRLKSDVAGCVNVKDLELELSGMVRLHAVSLEDHNVQLRVTRNFTEFDELYIKTIEDVAQAVVDQIGRWERKCHLQLSRMFDEELETSLRNVRRILPITKTRFKWDSSAQKQVKLLNARNK